MRPLGRAKAKSAVVSEFSVEALDAVGSIEKDRFFDKATPALLCATLWRVHGERVSIVLWNVETANWNTLTHEQLVRIAEEEADG
jgi:hypothetical protein